MALSERLAYILDFDVRGGVKSLEQVGKTADKELGKVESKVDKVGANLTKFGVGATAFAGVAGAALMKTAGEASDLAESVNAVNVTFGKSSDGIKKLGEEAARSVGLANSEFNGLAVQFSSFTQTVAGAQGRDVVAVMDELTTRTADFASVMNLDVPEAARVFQSALSGETEPIKKFGIDLSAAAVEQYALANGLIETKAELTETIKVQARYGLLMQETAQTQGDFANTADGAANSQRIMRAELKNAAAEIGEGVLPVMTQMIGLVTKGVGAFNQLNDATGGNVGTIATYGVAAIGAVGALSALAGQVIKARDSIKGFATNMTTAKANMIAAGVVVGAAVGLYSAYAGAKDRARQRTDDFVQALKEEKAGQEGASDALLISEFSQKKYADTLDKLGVSVADVVRAIKGEQIPALNDLTDKAIVAAIDGNNDYAGGLTELETQIGLYSSALSDAEKQTGRSAEATDTLSRKTEMYVEFAKGMRGELEAGTPVLATYDDRVEGVARALENAASAAEREEEQARENIETLKRLTDEYKDQKSRIDELIRAKTQLVGGEIAVRQAQREAKTAADELNTAIAEGTIQYSELGPALDEVVTQQKAAAEGAAQFAADQLRANGSTVDAQTEAYLLRQAYVDLANQTTGPTHDAIMQLIADLDAIPTNKTVNIQVLQNGQRVNTGGWSAIGGGIIQDGPDTGARATATASVAPVTNIYNAVNVQATSADQFMYDLDRMAKGLG